MAAPAVLSAEEIEALDDPGMILERAAVLEPMGRYAERNALLDRLERLLEHGPVPSAPPGRDWGMELLAEQAVSLSGLFRNEETLALADQVLREADPSCRIALGRAQLAAGQALAWSATEESAARSDRAFAEAVAHFQAVGSTEWQGSALLRWGYSLWFQCMGDLPRAKELVAEALAVWDPASVRLAGSYGYYADILVDLGELDEADAALDRGFELARRDGADKLFGELADTRARAAASRGDARATERLVRQAVRDASGHEWFATHMGTSTLLSAAQLLFRVDLEEQGLDYLHRGAARSGGDDFDLTDARAAYLARFGDPVAALAELQQVVRGDWFERRLIWRQELLTAWATFRAGRQGAGEIGVRVFDHLVAAGVTRMASAGEPLLIWPVASLAEQAGSATARRLLLGDRQLLVRLFGTPRLTRPDGTPVAVPPGKPAELVRMLSLHDIGLPVEVVVDRLFPDASLAAGRSRLRQVLSRLRAGAGEVVHRDGDALLLAPAWVDAREFLAAADRVRSAGGTNVLQRAYAALALHSGPFLPLDLYAPWAEQMRKRVDDRYLELLELVATAAAERGSYEEALTALEAAAAADPDGSDRYTSRAADLRQRRREADDLRAGR